jgi:hypothetical protein
MDNQREDLKELQSQRECEAGTRPAPQENSSDYRQNQYGYAQRRLDSSQLRRLCENGRQNSNQSADAENDLHRCNGSIQNPVDKSPSEAWDR